MSIQRDQPQIKRKPAQRLELLHFAGAWIGARYGRRPRAEIITAQANTPKEAAETLIAIAQETGLPVVMPAHLIDSLIAEWEIDGIEAEAAGHGPEACTNIHALAGWKAARAKRQQRRPRRQEAH